MHRPGPMTSTGPRAARSRGRRGCGCAKACKLLPLSHATHRAVSPFPSPVRCHRRSRSRPPAGVCSYGKTRPLTQALTACEATTTIPETTRAAAFPQNSATCFCSTTQPTSSTGWTSGWSGKGGRLHGMCTPLGPTIDSLSPWPPGPGGQWSRGVHRAWGCGPFATCASMP